MLFSPLGPPVLISGSLAESPAACSGERPRTRDRPHDRARDAGRRRLHAPRPDHLRRAVWADEFRRNRAALPGLSGPTGRAGRSAAHRSAFEVRRIAIGRRSHGRHAVVADGYPRAHEALSRAGFILHPVPSPKSAKPTAPSPANRFCSTPQERRSEVVVTPALSPFQDQLARSLPRSHSHGATTGRPKGTLLPSFQATTYWSPELPIDPACSRSHSTDPDACAEMEEMIPLVASRLMPLTSSNRIRRNARRQRRPRRRPPGRRPWSSNPSCRSRRTTIARRY